MDSPNEPIQAGRLETGRRLNSWKSIGAFFERDERTVRRWEAERGLPVHRVPGSGRASVYAYESELAEWLKTADTETPLSELEPEPSLATGIPAAPSAAEAGRGGGLRKGQLLVIAVAALLVLAIVLFALQWYLPSRTTTATNLPAGVKRAANPQAQEFYLQGLYHWNKRTPQDLNQALGEFTQAIVEDPNYAPAYVGLANCYNLLREYSLMPAKEAYPRAIVASQRAIALDDSLAEAHNALAFADFYWSWDAAGAEREFRRAIELDPNLVLAHHWHATFLMVLGRAEEALAEIERARELDPQSSAILADKGLILFSAGQEQQAIRLLERIAGSEPEFLSPHAYLAVIYLQIRDDQNYLSEAKRTAEMLGDADRLRVAMAGRKGYAAGGGPGMLKAMLEVQQELYASGKVDAYDLATTYCLSGDKQEALRLLERSVEKREPRVIALRIDQNLTTLHDEPAFRALLAKVGLPPLG